MATPKNNRPVPNGKLSIEQVQQKLKDQTEAWKKLLENLEKLKSGQRGPHQTSNPENNTK
ncbi:MAG: hypothetical protein KBH07_11770 [Flavobacteriales bacterium]|nr:hypothetical protein [Flavobacteriales bacterium]MBP9080034.1 hypothetical protein [Flavobacteriales bacterium]